MLARDAEPPAAPTWWPFWQVSPVLRVRLLDALNLTIERRAESGAWTKVGDGVYGRSMREIATALRRRGLSDAKDMPIDDRRWPYDMGARS